MITWQTTVAQATAFSFSSARFFTGPNEPGAGASQTRTEQRFTSSSENSSFTGVTSRTTLAGGDTPQTIQSVNEIVFGTANSSAVSGSGFQRTTYSTRLGTFAVTTSTTQSAAYQYTQTTYTTSSTSFANVTTTQEDGESAYTITSASLPYSSHLTTTQTSSASYERQTTTTSATIVGSNFLFATVYHAITTGPSANILWSMPTSADTSFFSAIVPASSHASSATAFTIEPPTQTATTEVIKQSDIFFYSKSEQTLSFSAATTTSLTATQSRTAIFEGIAFGGLFPQSTTSQTFFATETATTALTITTQNSYSASYNNANTSQTTEIATSWSSWQEKAANPTYAHTTTLLTTATRSTGNQTNDTSLTSSETGTYQIPHTFPTATGTNTQTFVSTTFQTQTSTTSTNDSEGRTFLLSTSKAITTALPETTLNQRVLVAHSGVMSEGGGAGLYSVNNMQGQIFAPFAKHSRYLTTIYPTTYDIVSTFSFFDTEFEDTGYDYSLIGTATLSGLFLTAAYASDPTATTTHAILPVENATTFVAETQQRAMSQSPMGESETFYETLARGAYSSFANTATGTFTTSGHTKSHTDTATTASTTAYFHPLTIVAPTTESAAAVVWSVLRNRTQSVV